MKEEIYTRNISYIGMWKDDEFNGNGKFSFGKRNVARSIFNVVIADYWIQYTSSCNFVDGLQEGEGVLTTKSYDDVSMERLLYSQGKIIRNYTKEANDKRSEESFQRYQAQKKITDCNNCTVDEEKTTFPKEGYFLMFSYDEPGKIVMKNGEKYDFYYKEGEKPWYIIDSYGIIFDDTTDFTSFDEMITELIKRCILKKCK